jgi:hypothetical protein
LVEANENDVMAGAQGQIKQRLTLAGIAVQTGWDFFSLPVLLCIRAT